MVHTKLLPLMMVASLGSLVYGMEEESCFLDLLPEEKERIALLLQEKQTVYMYRLFKKIEVGSPVTSVVVRPDGKAIITGSSDSMVRLWDVESGRQIEQFKGNAKVVDSVVFSPDETTMLTGAYDNAARLWDVETGKKLTELKGHRGVVRALAWSPNGKTILTGSDDKTAQLWDVASYKESKQFTDHTDAVTSVAFSSDGELLVTGSSDNSIILYRRYKESEEETKERCRKKEQLAEPDAQ